MPTRVGRDSGRTVHPWGSTHGSFTAARAGVHYRFRPTAEAGRQASQRVRGRWARMYSKVTPHMLQSATSRVPSCTWRPRSRCAYRHASLQNRRLADRASNGLPHSSHSRVRVGARIRVDVAGLVTGCVLRKSAIRSMTSRLATPRSAYATVLADNPVASATSRRSRPTLRRLPQIWLCQANSRPCCGLRNHGEKYRSRPRVSPGAAGLFDLAG